MANAAVAWAREHGAHVVEGYPVDLEGKKGKTSSAELYHSSISVFERAGFAIQARPYSGRALMRLEC